MIFSEAQAKEIIQKAITFSTADEVRVNLSGGRSGNTRFALNSITTSGDEDTLDLEVTAYFGKQKASARGTEMDDAGVKRLVKMAEELAHFAPEDPEYVPELGPQTYLPINLYFKNTANALPELRAKGVLSSIEPAQKKQLDAAGFFEHGNSFTAVGNNRDLFGYYKGTRASYSVTVRTADGTGSGWGSDSSRNIAEVNYVGVSNRAIGKAESSREPKILEPGVYPVILEPQAVADFLRFALFTMSARSADEGRSFYAKRGGGNKIGEKVVGENITWRSDPTHPDILGRPFGSDGFPAKKMVWIKNGVLKQLYYDRYWAQKQNKEPTGFPTNLIFEGGQGTLDELIKETDRAILVTRFWYIRFVDPQTILLTGLTRDGTFWVENGQVKHAIKNFRFNESPIAVLNKVTGLSKPVRAGGLLVPALRASEFTFSSLSEAV
jgi:predicted Zn-dependent protease